MVMNKNIYGFSLRTSRSLKELNGTIYEFIHDRTGLKLVWIKRPEENKTFGIAFETLPKDDTGVFHILEHSVLCGSRRYPVKEPFVELMKNSMNTFLNAMTFPDKTFYPVSSRSEKELMNLMRVYLDAVFHPLIHSRPEIFYQEGWHYAFDADGKPGYTGVVYNEMKGAFANADQQMYSAMMAGLFPDTPYRFVSGGDPKHIPELTYEKFLEYHRQCYHPSNGYVFLDGDMDIDAVLEIIDREFLKDFQPGQRLAPPSGQAPVDGGVKKCIYELAAGEPLEGHTRMGWGFVAGTFADREKIMAMNILSQVLCGSHQAPLCRAVLSRGLAQDVSMQVVDGIRQPWVLLDVKNLDASRMDDVKECIFSQLKTLADRGLDPEQLWAAMANLEFKLRERDYGSMPEGLILGMNVLESWLYGGEAWANLELGDLFQHLKAKAAQGYFEDLIRQVLLNNPHTCQVIMEPSHTLGQEQRSEEKQRVQKAASRWTQEERKNLLQLQEQLEIWQKTKDSAKSLACLPRLTLQDVPKLPEQIPTDLDRIQEIPVIRYDLPSHGIAYITLYFDADDFAREELPYLSMLCALMGKLRTHKSTGEVLLSRTRQLCGNLDFYMSGFQEKDRTDTCQVKLCVSFSTLEENAQKAADLVKEMMTQTCFDELSVIRDLLRQEKNALYQQIVMSGSSFAMSWINAQTSAAGAAGDLMSGIGFYQWLTKEISVWDEEDSRQAGGLPEHMEALARTVFAADRMTVSYTGDGSEPLKTVVQVLGDQMPKDSSKVRGPVGLKSSERKGISPYGILKEGVVIPADVSFTARGMNLSQLNCAYTGALALAARGISLNYLWNEIRMQGGAYGTGLTVSPSGLVCGYSYRDPNGSRSLEIYRKVGGFLRSFSDKKPDLTGLIIGAVSDATPLMTSRTKGLRADTDYWCKTSWKDRCCRRQELVDASFDTLKVLADVIEKAMDQGGLCIVGSKAQVEGCEGLDQVITL